MVEFKPLISVSYELVFQLINTFLVFWILKKLLFKPVMDIIEARANDIKSDLYEQYYLGKSGDVGVGNQIDTIFG